MLVQKFERDLTPWAELCALELVCRVCLFPGEMCDPVIRFLREAGERVRSLLFCRADAHNIMARKS
jgi:hypothetical protein